MAKPQRRAVKKKPLWQQVNLPNLSQVSLKSATFMAVGLVILGLALGIQTWLNNPINLPISQIDVQGELKYLKDTDLKQIIAKYSNTNLYLLDVDALEADLETQPWIRLVKLRRVWPSQLIVEVEEQRPIAFWGTEQLVNQFGELFTAELPGLQGIIPVLFSPNASGRSMAESYLQVTNQLKGTPVEVSELIEDSRGAWRLKLKGGIEVLLGNKDQEQRLARFKVAYNQALGTNAKLIRRVDLRYTNGLAVEWKQSQLSSL